MRLGERLRQVAIALVGDDHRGAGLGDAEIGAGYADIGGEEFLAQHGARLGDQGRRLLEPPRRVEVAMRLAEALGDLLLHQVDGWGNDVARILLADLDDVLAEIGLDRRDAVLLEVIVERDLLGDHRLALGHRLGAEPLTDRQHRVARLLRRAAPMHVPALRLDVLLEGLEVEIEILEHVVLDRLALVAQRLEFRKPRHGRGTAGGKAAAHQRQRLLQIGIAERLVRVVLEGVAGRLHQPRSGAAPMGAVASALPASTSATWRTRTRLPSRVSLPAMLRRQPMSPASSVSAPLATISAALSAAMRSEISGYLMQKVPPKPQHTSAPGSSCSRRPSTLASSRRGCSLTPSSRSPEQES